MMHESDPPHPAGEPHASARDRLDRCQAELVRLRRRVEAAEGANRRMAAEHARLDESVSVLTRLWVAATALHEAANEAQALRALEEVMINLAGSEEFGVFEVEGGALVPVHSFGVADGRCRRHAPAGVVARVLESGESWQAGSPHPGLPGEPVACIPLRIGERVAAVVVVWGFLPQKLAFEPFDRELWALLANRAAQALRAARLLEAAA
ncbi:MAG TPA: GAF domain-containing protein [Longimicrobium sp.]|nr:GAF domain-containing protein [Longimicrobium sp.]